MQTYLKLKLFVCFYQHRILIFTYMCVYIVGGTTYVLRIASIKYVSMNVYVFTGGRPCLQFKIALAWSMYIHTKKTDIHTYKVCMQFSLVYYRIQIRSGYFVFSLNKKMAAGFAGCPHNQLHTRSFRSLFRFRLTISDNIKIKKIKTKQNNVQN